MITKLQEDFLRPILRRAHYGRNRSSFPFLSGDTFKAFSDISISGSFDRFFNQFTSDQIRTKKIIFLCSDRGDALSEYLAEHEFGGFQNWKLVLHNSDEIPTPVNMERLSSNFEKIFCVNWLGSHDVATPIPIGLENFSYLRNGVPKDFSPANKVFQERGIQLLTAFTDSTNPVERRAARRSVSSLVGNLELQSPLRPSEYRKLLRNTRFVLSPPGNGSDCHRTWEAIYSGAVPIVKREYWPFSHLELPVLVVEEWAEISNQLLSSTDCTGIDPKSLIRLFSPSRTQRGI